MKVGSSLAGVERGKRRRFRWLAAAWLAIVVFVSACSSGDDNVGNSRSESTTKDEASEAAEFSFDSSDRSLEPLRTKEERGEHPKPQEEVQAGQLTAGEWDDLAAWEAFNDLLNSQEGDSSKHFWRFGNFHRLEVAVTANGRAVADAEVVLQSDNQTIWEARTNTDGIAYVYAGLYEREVRNNSAYKVHIRKGQIEKSMQELDMVRQGAIKIDIGAKAEGTEPSSLVDLMFVVDTTGSMQDELNYLSAELKDVVKRVADEHANQLGIRVSANFYRDEGDQYVTRPYPFTTDINQVVEQFGQQSAGGGGDYPEAVDQALRDAIKEHNWSKDARARLLFLVLDAPPHEDVQIIEEIHELIEEASSKGIRIIPVASSGVNVDTEYLLRFMSVATGGTYLFLTDDSGIGGDHLEPAAGEYEVKLLRDLLVEVINRYVS
ncbi:VWA domain-containing protein [Paenibacillus sp. strain BS8-2]